MPPFDRFRLRQRRGAKMGREKEGANERLLLRYCLGSLRPETFIPALQNPLLLQMLFPYEQFGIDHYAVEHNAPVQMRAGGASRLSG